MKNNLAGFSSSSFSHWLVEPNCYSIYSCQSWCFYRIWRINYQNTTKVIYSNGDFFFLTFRFSTRVTKNNILHYYLQHYVVKWEILVYSNVRIFYDANQWNRNAMSGKNIIELNGFNGVLRLTRSVFYTYWRWSNPIPIMFNG